MLQTLNRMKITTLLQVGFAAVLAMAALMAGVGVMKLREMVRLGDGRNGRNGRRSCRGCFGRATRRSLGFSLALQSLIFKGPRMQPVKLGLGRCDGAAEQLFAIGGVAIFNFHALANFLPGRRQLLI